MKKLDCFIHMTASFGCCIFDNDSKRGELSICSSVSKQKVKVSTAFLIVCYSKML